MKNKLLQFIAQIGIIVVIWWGMELILGGHTIISTFTGIMIAALCRGINEIYLVKKEYNNGICKTCGKPFDIEKRWYACSQGITMGSDIDTAVCNTCHTVTEIPGVRYR